jgi:hypothetical protein
VRTVDQVGGFLTALYSDSSLKRHLMLWTFVLLVVPTAVLVALGVPEKPAYLAMCALMLPLHFALYLRGVPRPLPKIDWRGYTPPARRATPGPVAAQHREPRG